MLFWLMATAFIVTKFREKMKTNLSARNTEALEPVSPQSVLVERVISVVSTLLASSVLIGAALERFFH